MNERDIARFDAKVDRSGGPDACHLWKAAVDAHGYGVFGFGPGCKKRLAHRVAFFLKHGRWPEPSCLHRCDTPVCVNDRHLFEGTQAQNMADMVSKGRSGYGHQCGERHGRAKLTDAGAMRLLALRGTMTRMEAALLFGLSAQHVGRIWSGVVWSHLKGETP